MALTCGICNMPVPSASAVCRHHGYINIVCVVCKNPVRAGDTGCGLCATEDDQDLLYPRPVEIVVLPAQSDRSPSGDSLIPESNTHRLDPGAQLAHFELPPPVPGRYVTNLHGAQSVVELGGDDAAILTDIQNGAVMLQALAVRMNHLGAMIPTTRKTIRECRELAAKLQEEVEERLGPLGARRR